MTLESTALPQPAPARYNLCPEVARCLGLDTKSNAKMWRDRAMVEVSVAVMQSFREAGMGESVHWVEHMCMCNSSFIFHLKPSAFTFSY